MKICVISDSHKETGNIQKVIDCEDFDLLIHLGDDYCDMDGVEIKQEFIRVPGVYDKEYFDTGVEKRIIKKFGAFRFLLTHTLNPHENDLEAGVSVNPGEICAKGGVDVVLFGHTHKPEISYDGKILFINPGHLKSDDKRGYEASYAILEVDENKIKINSYKLNELK
jgi:hypothetical protein